MKQNQRFIAGATCPKCGEIDSLLINTEDQSIECVDCEYQQTAAERDEQQATDEHSAMAKSKPKKVNVSDIIRITQVKE